MKLFRLAAFCLCPGLTGAAHATASQSGVILPITVEALPAVPDEGPPQIPFDGRRSYAASGEAVTIYVTRNTFPNAALWFERADAMLKLMWTPRGLGEAGPTASFSFGGSASPNGITRTYAMSGDNKSTSLSVMQVGQWIVKVRSTSSTLDTVGQSARMGRIIAAIKTREPVTNSNPLVLPENCPSSAHSIFGSLGSEAMQKPKAEIIMMAGMVALVTAGDASGGPKSLAADPSSYCKGTLTQGQNVAALYWAKDAAHKGWTMLIADSGRSLSGETLPLLDTKKSKEGGMLTANQLDGVEVLMLTKGGVPLPEASLPLGLNHITRGGQVLTAVQYGTNTIAVSLPK